MAEVLKFRVHVYVCTDAEAKDETRTTADSRLLRKKKEGRGHNLIALAEFHAEFLRELQQSRFPFKRFSAISNFSNFDFFKTRNLSPRD